MGASIWTIVEYFDYNSYTSFGEINLPRDIKFLCAIAWGDGGCTGDMPFPPRGFPADASDQSRDSFFVNADEVRDYLDHFRGGQELSLEEYAREYGEGVLKEYKETGRLPMPELTHQGWLTLMELEANLAQRNLKPDDLLPQSKAMLAAMSNLAATYGKDRVRLVFWIGI
jgi:hypothetical protein